MDLSTTQNSAQSAEVLIRTMEDLRAAMCRNCGASLCHHQVLMSIVMGLRNAPLCFDCLAGSLQCEHGDLAQSLRAHIDHRDCYREAWAWATRQETEPIASCPVATSPRRPSTQLQRADTAILSEPQNPIEADAAWDAGEMGCGDLVLELRQRLHVMRPAQVLKLYAQDPGAPEDLPAWCRLTGHRLLRMNHPEYWIQRKE